jgi:hypothetical protein
VLDATQGQAETVDEADALRMGNALEALRESLTVGDMEPARVDASDAANGHRNAACRADHGRVELLAFSVGALLRVIELGQRAPVRHGERPVIDQDRRGDERAGQRAATGLVAARDVADAELPVELEELRGLSAAALQRLRRLADARRGRFRTGASS